ncbi:hypothetical protein MVLG_02868 [Microbotryum lychnidis-dioicae p1A1 Lamole]|uniref:RING-type domain-containing protein n=1 Tax=Microbotryum lychnidis-dioicae (strain p1A1 Lamole / MvSl-1064) TaxID=683840 RepID=U5H6G8_USTV1|nr:hypothetical protein MVLG_02868 [Microbotryum lychnidis-dioicae p1A1 Lamole]|eukprot:KDE06832.1 hypothetical protein MVLG_02868 [Microbotryum lychnidis-dioicae p1A1 Lamole]
MASTSSASALALASASTSTSALHSSPVLPSVAARATPPLDSTRFNLASSPAESAPAPTTHPRPTADHAVQSDSEPDTDDERGLPPPVRMRPASRVAVAIAGAATTTTTTTTRTQFRAHPQRTLQSSRQNRDQATTSTFSRAETPVLDLTDDQAERSSPAAQDDESLLILHSSQPQTTAPVPSKRKRLRSRSRSSSHSRSRSRSRSPSQPTSLSNLTCPICFGPPVPIAATSCGHVFCAPCLHAALLAGPELTPPPPRVAAEVERNYGANGFGRRINPAGGGGGIFNPSRGRNRSRVGPTTTNNRSRSSYGGGASTYAHHPTPPWDERIENDDNEEEELDDYEIYHPPNRNRQQVPPPLPPPPPPGELDKHCPVCRKPLRGGWGRALRGVVLRMEPKKSKETVSVTGKETGTGKVMEGGSDVEGEGTGA